MGVRVVFPDMGKDPSVQLIEKTITENGTYDAITDGANGYSKVNVNVEGGGGSSDFSTAEVTMVTRTEQGMPSGAIYNVVYISLDDEMYQNQINGSRDMWNIVLYKGTGTYGAEGIISVEGSASYDSEEETITITGDCTVTLYYGVV